MVMYLYDTGVCTVACEEISVPLESLYDVFLNGYRARSGKKKKTVPFIRRRCPLIVICKEETGYKPVKRKSQDLTLMKKREDSGSFYSVSSYR